MLELWILCYGRHLIIISCHLHHFILEFVWGSRSIDFPLSTLYTHRLMLTKYFVIAQISNSKYFTLTKFTEYMFTLNKWILCEEKKESHVRFKTNINSNFDLFPLNFWLVSVACIHSFLMFKFQYFFSFLRMSRQGRKKKLNGMYHQAIRAM